MQSVLHQSYATFELWVLENGSSDRTAEVAKSFSDPRVKVFELGPVGFQGALGFALDNAQTEWLARMDADDISFPDRIRVQMEVVEKCPDIVLIGTRFAELTPFGHIFEPAEIISSREISPQSFRLRGSTRRFFADASVIFRRSTALEAGGYDPEFQMGDVPLWLRMLHFGKGWELASPMYLARLRPISMSSTQTGPSDQSYRVVAKYIPELLHLYQEESAQQTTEVVSRDQQFWLKIARLELLTGDRRAVIQALDFLERDGIYEKQARKIRWLNLGHISSIYLRWRKSHTHRHRPDWEKLLANFVGPLSLEY